METESQLPLRNSLVPAGHDTTRVPPSPSAREVESLRCPFAESGGREARPSLTSPLAPKRWSSSYENSSHLAIFLSGSASFRAFPSPPAGASGALSLSKNSCLLILLPFPITCHTLHPRPIFCIYNLFVSMELFLFIDIYSKSNERLFSEVLDL